MNPTGTLLRMFGAAILLIGVQFASVAAEAHAGHSNGHDGHGARAHGAAVGIAHLTSAVEAGSISAVEAGSAHPVAQAQPAAQNQAAAQAETTVRNAGGVSPSGSNACVIGCCGGTGCCGAALVAVSPDLPPRACSPRIGLARVISIRGADPRGLRKPPRSLA